MEEISVRTLIDSILDVFITKPQSGRACGLWSREPKVKPRSTPARVRILETECFNKSTNGGGAGPKFILEVLWIGRNRKARVVPLVESVVTRSARPRFSFVISSTSDEYRVTLSAQSETECQRWISVLLEILSSASSVRKSKRYSLCLSNYFFSVIDTKRAEQCGLEELQYWAVLDRTGLTLLPQRYTNEEARTVTFPMERIDYVRLANVENAVDIGKVIEIGLKGEDRCSWADGEKAAKTKRTKRRLFSMTRRWRHKSPKKVSSDENAMTPTATLGYHTLSLFCPDAQKFVSEWKSCQNLNAITKPPKQNQPNDINGNRLSSSSNGSQSTSNTSHSNLSALNSFLRRSLPSLNTKCTLATPPCSSPTASVTRQPPPLPSRKELEQRENELLLERQLRRHWREGEEEKEADSHPPSAQYKLLPAEPIPLVRPTRLDCPPPLPPKTEPRKRNGREHSKDAFANYKLLPPLPAPGPPPPLPPRKADVDGPKSTYHSTALLGYKTLTSVTAVEPDARSRRNEDKNGTTVTGVRSKNECKDAKVYYQNGYRLQNTLYSFLPDPAPLPRKRPGADEIPLRRSLETEV